VLCAGTSGIYGEAGKEDHARIVVLSDVVGEVIDVDEREKYGLFLDFPCFESAVFLQIADGSYRIRVTYEKEGKKRHQTIGQSLRDIKMLQDYVEHYDEITGSEDARQAFREKWETYVPDSVPAAQPDRYPTASSVRSPTDTMKDDFGRGYLEGRRFAKEKGTGGGYAWFISALGGSTLGCCVGGACVMQATRRWQYYMPETADPLLRGKSDGFRRGFAEAYRKASRDKALLNSTIGCIAGSLVSVLVAMILDQAYPSDDSCPT
jgi:hypothetical protein